MTTRNCLKIKLSNFWHFSAVLMVIAIGPAWCSKAQEIDSDNDGMSDNYELFFSLNPTNSTDATLDNDLDSLLNYDESILWTDPNEVDTDLDGFSDCCDSNPLSRIVIRWGEPLYTTKNIYNYTGPFWWTTACKIGGNWLTNVPFGWRGAPVNLMDGMVWIPAGTNSGTDPDNNGLPYELVVRNSFYMDQTEVTRQEWRTVRDWAITNGYTDLPNGYGRSSIHPVYSNNWYDCVKWCNARSEKEGFTPAYYTTSAKTTIYRTGEIDLEDDCVKWYGGYRLPTEMEWEYAARGGVSSRRFPTSANIKHSRCNYYSTTNYNYDESTTLGYHPAYSSNGIPYTSPEKSFVSFGYGDGLYDVIGNVAEWVWNWNTTTKRTKKGGSWSGNANQCRLRYKSGNLPGEALNTLGFRSLLCKNKGEELIIGVDREVLTNNAILAIDFFTATNSSLYIGLADSNHVWVASNLFGNIIVGSGLISNETYVIQFEEYTDTSEIHIWSDTGEVTVYGTRLYIDQDFDELDDEQEAQLGSSPTSKDTDNDGMPDMWEYIHGFQLTNPADALADADNDGVSNLNEFLRQTNPTDPQEANIIFYVDPIIGNDANFGWDYMASWMFGPKKSITNAIAVALSGDVIHAAAGEYFEELRWVLGKKEIILVPQGTVVLK